MSAERKYTALRRLADRGRKVESCRATDPYPRPTGPAPSLEDLRRRRDEIEEIVTRHGAARVRVFGSVARGDSALGSDVDLLVDGGEPLSTFGQAALQGELEDLPGCPVHVMTTRGLRRARAHPGGNRARSRRAVSQAGGGAAVGAFGNHAWNEWLLARDSFLATR